MAQYLNLCTAGTPFCIASVAPAVPSASCAPFDPSCWQDPLSTQPGRQEPESLASQLHNSQHAYQCDFNDKNLIVHYCHNLIIGDLGRGTNVEAQVRHDTQMLFDGNDASAHCIQDTPCCWSVCDRFRI